jgi:hypothetical protein
MVRVSFSLRSTQKYSKKYIAWKDKKNFFPFAHDPTKKGKGHFFFSTHYFTCTMHFSIARFLFFLEERRKKKKREHAITHWYIKLFISKSKVQKRKAFHLLFSPKRV